MVIPVASALQGSSSITLKSKLKMCKGISHGTFRSEKALIVLKLCSSRDQWAFHSSQRTYDLWHSQMYQTVRTMWKRNENVYSQRIYLLILITPGGRCRYLVGFVMNGRNYSGIVGVNHGTFSIGSGKIAYKNNDSYANWLQCDILRYF